MKMVFRHLVLGGLASTLMTGPVLAEPKAELVLAIGGEPDTGYDPLLGWGRYGHPLFQSTLLKRDAELETRADLAKSWSLSEDRLTWTIKVREDARFSDGTPLTAKDVAFTFNEGAKSGGALDLTVLERATAIDGTTVSIELKRPWITFAENFYSVGIVPAASYRDSYASDPVGSGPYKLVSWSRGEQLIVEANPEYYGPHAAFDKITFLFTDEDTSLAAAQAGQVDMVSVPAALADLTPDGFKQLSVKSVDNRGITFPIPGPSLSEDGTVIGNAVTSDRAIRRAINLGVDREKLVEVALLGHGTPAYGPADGLPWSNPDAAVSYDLDKAKVILDEAGWTAGDDGIRVKDGVRAVLPINYPASDSTRQALSVALAELLKPLGIEASAKGLSWDRIGAVMHAEPVMFGWGSHSPLEVYNLYESRLSGVDYFNVGYFSEPSVDRHLADAQAAESLEASYADWQKAAWDGTDGFGPKGEAGWAWLVNLDHLYLVNECLDIGATQTEPHGHGWPITALIEQWKWTCE